MTSSSGTTGDVALRRQRLRRSPRLPQGHRRMTAWAETNVEPLADLRARRRHEVAGPRGPCRSSGATSSRKSTSASRGHPGGGHPSASADLACWCERAPTKASGSVGRWSMAPRSCTRIRPTVRRWRNFPTAPKASSSPTTAPSTRCRCGTRNPRGPDASTTSRGVRRQTRAGSCRRRWKRRSLGRTVSVIHHRAPFRSTVPVVATLQFEPGPRRTSARRHRCWPLACDPLLVHFRDDDQRE